LTIAITDDERDALLEEAPGLAVAMLPNIHRVCRHVAPVSTRTDLFSSAASITLRMSVQ
jgi:hypothetical protein